MPKGIKGYQKGHTTSQETRDKISKANRGVWVEFNCDYCGEKNEEKISHFGKKRRHFCNIKCYSLFREEKMDMVEQPAYKGIRKEGQSKQVYHRNYCKRNPERIAHLKARRYAREKGAIGSHTLQEWEDLKAKFNNRCASCGMKTKLTKDHIIPLSENGTDFIDNIQPLCKNCNSRKWKFIYENPNLLNKSK